MTTRRLADFSVTEGIKRSASNPKQDLAPTNTSTQDVSVPEPSPPTAFLPSSTELPFRNILHEASFVFLAASGQLITQAGFAQGLVPATAIGSTFSATSPASLSWFSASYALTTGTFILISGRLGDIYGYKTLFLLGYAWFALWSLIAGTSYFTSSAIFFDVCRALQGVGPAVLIPNGLALLGVVYQPGPRKDMVFSIFGAAAPVGFMLGALFSALLAQFAVWPWAYWVMSIFAAVLAAASGIVIPGPSRVEESRGGGKVRYGGAEKFDILGSAVGGAGLICFNVAWNQAPLVGWGQPYVIVLLIVGFLCILVFSFIEWRTKNPIVPVRNLSTDVFFVLAIITFGWSSFGILIFYFCRFMETLRSVSPLGLVAQLVPIILSGPVAAITTGFLMSKVRMSIILIPALLAFCVGNIILATMPVRQSYWFQAFWALVVMPWGMDMSFPVSTVILSNLIGKSGQGMAASLVTTIVNYSISIGLGVAGTAESNMVNGNLLTGFRSAWYTGIGLSSCGTILAIVFAIKDVYTMRTDENKRQQPSEQELNKD